MIMPTRKRLMHRIETEIELGLFGSEYSVQGSHNVADPNPITFTGKKVGVLYLQNNKVSFQTYCNPCVDNYFSRI